jgi:hypothetical protein
MRSLEHARQQVGELAAECVPSSLNDCEMASEPCGGAGGDSSVKIRQDHGELGRIGLSLRFGLLAIKNSDPQITDSNLYR